MAEKEFKIQNGLRVLEAAHFESTVNVNGSPLIPIPALGVDYSFDLSAFLPLGTNPAVSLSLWGSGPGAWGILEIKPDPNALNANWSDMVGAILFFKQHFPSGGGMTGQGTAQAFTIATPPTALQSYSSVLNNQSYVYAEGNAIKIMISYVSGSESIGTQDIATLMTLPIAGPFTITTTKLTKDYSLGNTGTGLTWNENKAVPILPSIASFYDIGYGSVTVSYDQLVQELVITKNPGGGVYSSSATNLNDVLSSYSTFRIKDTANNVHIEFQKSSSAATFNSLDSSLHIPCTTVAGYNQSLNYSTDLNNLQFTYVPNNDGKVLTAYQYAADGSGSQWQSFIPNQGGNSGKYLTTDGSKTSWATVSGGGGSSLPSQDLGTAGKYLTSDGQTASWGTVSSYSAPTIGSTTISSGSTVQSISGLYTINGLNIGRGASDIYETNTALGTQPLWNSNAGAHNTAIGRQTLYNTTSENNTAIGSTALFADTTGTGNTAVGANAMYYNTSGSYNTAIGYYAGGSGSVGQSNLITGQNNTVIGYNASPSTTSASNEITFGNSSITRLRVPGLGIDWTSANVPGANISFNAQTSTTYTPVLSDNQKVVTMNNASANIFYVPTNASVAIPVGGSITILQIGAGQTTIVATTPGTTTIASAAGTPASPKLRTQYSSVMLVKAGTDLWYALGDII